jgi:hypothetical protein
MPTPPRNHPGLFDLHVHSGPDVAPRRRDDAGLVEIYRRSGFAGFVLKGHFDSTVGRAKLVTGPGIQVFGGLTLNGQVAGFNPQAVAVALAMGARVIWMPTLDARSSAPLGVESVARQAANRGRGYAAPPLDDSNAEAVTAVLEIIADHDAVLATGHLGPEETRWVVRRALDVGVQRIVLTHPSFTVPDLGLEMVAELTRLGAFAEVTAFQLYRQPGMTARRLAQLIRMIGVNRVILSSDMGRVDLPDPPQALARLIDSLARQGIDEGSLLQCAGSTPLSLVAP